MWASFIWLGLGNLFIGLIEGFILTRMTGCRTTRPYLLMIAANYFSALLGYCALRVFNPWLERTLTVENFLPVFAALMVFAWAWSVLLEYPFVWFSFPRRLRRSRWLTWRASLVAQSVSYACLLLWFGTCSSISMVTDTTRSTPAELSAGRAATVYYVSGDGTELRRIRSDGTGDVFVSNTSAKRVDPFGFPALRVALKSGVPALVFGDVDHPVDLGAWGYPYAALESLSEFASLDMPDTNGWSAEYNFWAIGGLSVHRWNQSVRLAVETPFSIWYVRSPTVLAGGLVVFECGKQVLLYDASTKRLAFLTRGRSPLVIPDAPPPAGFKLGK